MDFYDRFIKLCVEKGVKPSPMLESIGIQKTAATNWKNRKTKPTACNLQKIADYFGVTVEYLKGETENPSAKNDKGDREWYAMDGEPGAQTVNVNINVMDELNELLKAARNLPVEKIRLLIEVAKAMQ